MRATSLGVALSLILFSLASCAGSLPCDEECPGAFSTWISVPTSVSGPTMRFALARGFVEIRREQLLNWLDRSDLSPRFREILLREIQELPEAHEPIILKSSGFSAPGFYVAPIREALERGASPIFVDGIPVEKLRFRDVEYSYKADREYWSGSGELLYRVTLWIA
jgi:hypothetical protein